MPSNDLLTSDGALLTKHLEYFAPVVMFARFFFQASQINFAFGSSTPRILGSRHDSSADIWGGGTRRFGAALEPSAQLVFDGTAFTACGAGFKGLTCYAHWSSTVVAQR